MYPIRKTLKGCSWLRLVHFFNLAATISSSHFCLVLHQNQVKSLLTGAGGYFCNSEHVVNVSKQ